MDVTAGVDAKYEFIPADGSANTSGIAKLVSGDTPYGQWVHVAGSTSQTKDLSRIMIDGVTAQE